MKSLIMILFLTVSLFCQDKLSESECIKNTHIDFSTQTISFVLHGMIEIDGHTFYNDTCKDPVVYEANLDNVRIHDSNTNYEHRLCNKPKCKVIHLKRAYSHIIDYSPYGGIKSIPLNFNCDNDSLKINNNQ